MDDYGVFLGKFERIVNLKIEFASELYYIVTDP